MNFSNKTKKNNMKAISITLGLILTSIAFLSCNIEERVMKRQDAFNNIGRKWLELNPCVNDSSVVYLPGRVDSVLVEVEVPVMDTPMVEKIIDSIKESFKLARLDDAMKVRISYSKGYNDADQKWISKLSNTKVPRKNADTIKIFVADKQKISLLEKDIDQLVSNLANTSIELQKKIGKSKQWFWLFVVACILLSLAVYFNIKKK
jgi:hypothetical protein